MDLPDADLEMSCVAFCPGKSLMLMQQMSPGGGRGRQYTVLSVLDFGGRVLHSAEAPAWLHGTHLHWAPSGAAVALVETVDTADPEFCAYRAWVWDLSQKRPVLIEETSVRWTAWATPSAASLLVGFEEQQVANHVTSATGQSQQIVQLPALQPWTSRERQGAVVWGRKLAVQSGWQQAGNGYHRLELFSLQGSQLVLQNTISATAGVFADCQLQLSDDGELLAALRGLPDGSSRSRTLSRTHLVLVSLASGSVREFPLQGSLAEGVAQWGVNLRWSADCTAVLVSILQGQVCQLFNFA